MGTAGGAGFFVSVALSVSLCERSEWDVENRTEFGLREMERVAGIEPASQAWEACALPLDDTRKRETSYQIRGALSTETRA